RHVEFGERQTMRVIQDRPRLRRRLLGFNILSLWSVRRLGTSMQRTFGNNPSAVMRQLPAFALAVAASPEGRLQRMGLLDRPLAQIPGWRQLLLVAEAHAGKVLGRVFSLVAAPLRAFGLLPRRRLTDIYLADPDLRRPQAD